MRQQVPLEGLNVWPLGILRIDEKALIVPEHIEQHQAKEAKKQVLRTQPRVAFDCHWSGRHLKILAAD
jgi:hypothetical protein